MSARTVECVPNFSEGRNQTVIDAISNAGRGIPGAGTWNRARCRLQ